MCRRRLFLRRPLLLAAFGDANCWGVPGGDPKESTLLAAEERAVAGVDCFDSAVGVVRGRWLTTDGISIFASSSSSTIPSSSEDDEELSLSNRKYLFTQNSDGASINLPEAVATVGYTFIRAQTPRRRRNAEQIASEERKRLRDERGRTPSGSS